MVREVRVGRLSKARRKDKDRLLRMFYQGKRRLLRVSRQ